MQKEGHKTSIKHNLVLISIQYQNNVIKMHYIMNSGNGKAPYDKEMIQIYNQNYTQINIQ